MVFPTTLSTCLTTWRSPATAAQSLGESTVHPVLFACTAVLIATLLRRHHWRWNWKVCGWSPICTIGLARLVGGVDIPTVSSLIPLSLQDTLKLSSRVDDTTPWHIWRIWSLRLAHQTNDRQALRLKLIQVAKTHRSLFQSVLATAMLYCNSDEFSWAMLHAVYFSLMSAELSASTRTCRRVTADELGLCGRPKASEGGIMDDQTDGTPSVSAYTSALSQVTSIICPATICAPIPRTVQHPSRRTRLSVRRIQPSLDSSDSLHAVFRDFLHTERLKPRPELLDIARTSATDLTFVLRPTPATPSFAPAVHWALDTNSVLVDRLCQLSLASTSPPAAARFNAALDDFLHAERDKPRCDRIGAVWGREFAVRGAGRSR